MRRIAAWIQLSLALMLLTATGVGAYIVHGQVRRDRECVADLRRHIASIEAFRTQNHRLPRFDELTASGPTIIAYRVVAPPAVQPTPRAEGYELSMWRGERAVQYASSTGLDTCSSGAIQAGLWLAVLGFVPAVALLVRSAQNRRRFRGAG